MPHVMFEALTLETMCCRADVQKRQAEAETEKLMEEWGDCARARPLKVHRSQKALALKIAAAEQQQKVRCQPVHFMWA